MQFLENMSRGRRQRVLQISLGVGMVVLVVLVELIAIEPAGIYAYTQGKYKTFSIGMDKRRVLSEVNRFKAIRQIQTCTPYTLEELKHRRHFKMSDALETSRTWICRFRNGNKLMFIFTDAQLNRMLLLKGRLGKPISSELFQGCRPELQADVDRFLQKQAEHPVFYH